MEEILKAFLDAGYDFSMTNQPRRVEGKDGWRELQLRVVWKATNEDEDTTYESDWEGFETVEEAIEDIKKNFSDLKL